MKTLSLPTAISHFSKRTAVLLLLLGASLCSIAQVKASLDDTIRNPCRTYYYTDWYDRCPSYYNESNYWEDIYSGAEIIKVAQKQYIDRPMQVRGAVALVAKSLGSYLSSSCVNTNYAPEYVSVGYYNADSNRMEEVASARWDTVMPVTMDLQLAADGVAYRNPWGTTGNNIHYYCNAYQVYFDKPVLMDSNFFVIGTRNGSRRTYISESQDWIYTSNPVAYAYVAGEACSPKLETWICYSDQVGYMDPAEGWHNTTLEEELLLHYHFGRWGIVLPIVDYQFLLDVKPAEEGQGWCQGIGTYFDSATAVITALPSQGFTFSHWNDGDTSNPRSVLVLQDTAFTAYFDPIPQYALSVSANDDAMGLVYGAGTYYVGDTAIMVAQPKTGFKFVRWNDSIGTSQRRVVVTQDTAFTAIFASRSMEGIDEAPSPQCTLMPNPASGMVTVSCGQTAIHSIEVLNAAGQTLLRREVKASETAFDVTAWPKGAYMVLAHTANGTMTQKLVVK